MLRNFRTLRLIFPKIAAKVAQDFKFRGIFFLRPASFHDFAPPPPPPDLLGLIIEVMAIGEGWSRRLGKNVFMCKCCAWQARSNLEPF